MNTDLVKKATVVYNIYIYFRIFVIFCVLIKLNVLWWMEILNIRIAHNNCLIVFIGLGWQDCCSVTGIGI